VRQDATKSSNNIQVRYKLLDTRIGIKVFNSTKSHIYVLSKVAVKLNRINQIRRVFYRVFRLKSFLH